MRRVVSVSLGSSRRNHTVTAEFLGVPFQIERIGTDGDLDKAVAMIRELDGKVDAFGLGGIDLYIRCKDRRYTLRGALPLVRAATKTPVVDGSGLKNTLERRAMRYLRDHPEYGSAGKKVLIVCAVDRFGMAEAAVESGAEVIFGDLMFSLGVPVPIRSLQGLDRLARVVAPAICLLPFEWLYPTGKKQDQAPRPKYERYYQWADVIAGDLHFIRKYLPDRLDGKTIVTNTVTKENIEEFRARGVSTLVTTTPELGGRSFGTNVMEGVLVALSGKPMHDITTADYESLLDAIGFQPRIEKLEG